MKIEFTQSAGHLEVRLDGRLDTNTSPELERFLGANLNGISALTMDCAKLSYVSSAGLRVLLSTQKKMKGAMTLKNVCELVMEVFEMTGFVDILVLE